ncbi:MAG: hypothetical protein B7Y45_03385 [Sphingomonas sp. 28-66-16]|nr:MAG: hypothetical protein B7Y45_03385 [Sphingomonas sp. 28-66-16]
MITRKRTIRLSVRVGIALLAFIMAALLVLAMLPWGVFKGQIEQRLAARTGQTVSIGTMAREDLFSLSPVVHLTDVSVTQPAWAGPGKLAAIRSIRVRFPVLPLLVGKFRPTMIEVDGARVALVRDRTGRRNWQSARKKRGDGAPPSITSLTLHDVALRYRDAVQKRVLDLSLAADARGVAVKGSGTIRGSAVTVRARGAPLLGAAAHWPFTAAIDGRDLEMRAQGTMARPLDTGNMALDVSARASDLKMIDAVIEAGLFGTQPVRLTAHARHDGARWSVERLRGTIGGSTIAGHVTATREGGRTRLDGAVTSDRLNFDDFATDAGQAAARALERANGPKIVPNTRINIKKIDSTDGQIRFDVGRIVSARGASALTSMSGLVSIDHQLMKLSNFRIGLTKGVITGRVTVDQRGGRAEPTVTLDLTLKDGSIAALAGGDDKAIDASLAGRVKLAGVGSTVREAVGHAGGSIGLAAQRGALPAKVAAMMGFDVARSLTRSDSEQAQLRCVIARFEVTKGVGRADPVLVDTSLSQSHAEGTLRFPSEALALSVTGAPKRDSALRLPGSITITGTVRDPQVVVPHEVKSVGNILKGIGRAITGKQGPVAKDADCGALAASALR